MAGFEIELTQEIVKEFAAVFVRVESIIDLWLEFRVDMAIWNQYANWTG